MVVIFPHARVQTSGCSQLFVCAFLHYMAGIQDYYPIRSDYSGETVRDHDHGASFCEGGEGLLYKDLIFRVCESSSFIQHDDRRILEDSSCQSYALLFASGQVCAFRSDNCIYALRELGDDVVALCCGQGCKNFVSGGIRSYCRTFSRMVALKRWVF